MVSYLSSLNSGEIKLLTSGKDKERIVSNAKGVYNVEGIPVAGKFTFGEL